MRHEPTNGFSIEAHREQRAITLCLSGELDIGSSPTVEAHLAEHDDLESCDTIVIDLRALRFLDSSGLRALFWLDDQSRRAGCRAVFIRGPRAVRRIFEVTALGDRLEMVDDPAEIAPIAEGPGRHTGQA